MEKTKSYRPVPGLGFHAKIPLIVYNGAFVKDNVTGEILLSYDFSDDIFQVLDDLLAHHIYPIVYYTVHLQTTARPCNL